MSFQIGSHAKARVVCIAGGRTAGIRPGVPAANQLGVRRGLGARCRVAEDAKQATGQLITEIQIGQRMLGIIESSARYAQAMEANIESTPTTAVV